MHLFENKSYIRLIMSDIISPVFQASFKTTREVSRNRRRKKGIWKENKKRGAEKKGKGRKRVKRKEKGDSKETGKMKG